MTKETFYRLTIKDKVNNTNEPQPLAYYTQSAALDSAYRIMEQHGGIEWIDNAGSNISLWNDCKTFGVEVNPILI